MSTPKYFCPYFYFAGSTWGVLHSQLSEVVSQTAIGDVLGSVGETECEEFFQHYLHDFVRSVYRCYHKQQKSKNLEYKVGLRMIESRCIQTSRGRAVLQKSGLLCMKAVLLESTILSYFGLKNYHVENSLGSHGWGTKI